MTTKLAQSLKLSDLQLYTRLWDLRDRPIEERWEWNQIVANWELDITGKSLAKAFERLGKKLKKPYKKRGEIKKYKDRQKTKKN